MTEQPTIVLIHGAFTDASAWNGVSAHLQDMGYKTVAPAIPLRGFGSDAQYLSAYLTTIDGPLILVGHSYGGSIISHPAMGGHDIKALVFIAAFAPDTGESMAELNERFPGSQLGDATTVVREHPGGNDLYLLPEHFSSVYAADLSAPVVALMAASQRPLNVTALGETLDGVPTWSLLPSWAVVATADCSLPAEAQRFMAKRAGSAVTEVHASHALPISQPDAVAGVIDAAARSVCVAAV
jgi:pimeloyl-ACP methyl ester carboxylesterase